MENLNLDWKDVVKNAFAEVLDELKENFGTFYKETILPGAKEAKEEFIAKLKEEAQQSSSVWVKIRNSLITVGVNVVAAVLSKVIDNFISDEENKQTAQIEG